MSWKCPVCVIASRAFLFYNLAVGWVLEVNFMFQYFNPNPQKRIVGDCAVRAMSAALNLDWDSAYALISANGFIMADMPNANSVWGKALHDRGFDREIISNTCPDCYTAQDFCNDHSSGIYVLGFGTHVATVRDGVILDSWDSSREIPQYYWRR